MIFSYDPLLLRGEISDSGRHSLLAGHSPAAAVTRHIHPTGSGRSDKNIGMGRPKGTCTPQRRSRLFIHRR
ncbi:hypothetical protein EIO_2950 (plasmid) [Ketogulonicigenium vulgare Y25]|uniref:Uncharacterized protein n=1 Tax=Ketogulonicigenium vulgare (strain WSH-001) TaxID=759362 RepID=F9YAZ4_KETVW|nr:hypothetical protein EIO_2950 [Ketogulonicigenium vulgare Y25]AEM42546.1 hypothetical protein KVU_PA0127 [Ketogulonicigenium vulgare WSH-001]ALJ82579.1 hypothetical protein KVH_14860 [Ketogulonicigenium vulgare]ANW35436.1 hypothetical protein KvSKV_14750 [Ketogulonicigenium vulgare]